MQLHSPEELEELPDGRRILDGDTIAIKKNGAWHYPEGVLIPQLPVTLLDD
jgi:hypothetical protein